MVSLSSTRRTRVFGAVTAALVVGGFAFAGPTAGRMMPPPPVDGAGAVSCSVSGNLSFNPPLQVGGTATTETVTLKAHLTGCTGTGDGANIVTGAASVSGTTTSNDCQTVLLTPPTSARSGPLKWHVVMGTHKLTPSTITFDSLAHTGGATKTDPIVIDTGGSSTAGSFNGDTAAAHTLIRETGGLDGTIAKHCVNMHGLKALHFMPGSTFSLTAPSPS